MNYCGTEFGLKNKEGVAFWLEASVFKKSYLHGVDTIYGLSIPEAVKDICRKCPLASACKPKLVSKESWTWVNMFVGGAEVTNDKCLLRSRGVAPKDVAPYVRRGYDMG